MGKILVTGGTGFIGSHTCVALIRAGYQVVVADNLSHSKVESLARIQMITGKTPRFYQADMRDAEALRQVFLDHQIDGVIHFAGLKAVAESVEQPLAYYENNVYGTLQLLRVMEEYGCKKLVFSSSATVYGAENTAPYRENMETSAVNPYGQTKLMIEQILEDICQADDSWSIAALRYFNPIGAHESGLLGEDPSGIPTNLVPCIARTVMGKQNALPVYGKDYDTPDGTGIRDYVHVMDLAEGHIAALAEYTAKRTGFRTFNLGTGKGYSVLEVVQTYEKVCGKRIPLHTEARRNGDVAVSYADVTRAKEELKWEATAGLSRMCADSWRFICQNPRGLK
ncbi:MAG: UDP-glucose 4-epimerase GalE [Ruminococcus sp.]|nr:UDP-glucose 4-epimerase GalE [Ruminococcus sp.]